MSESQQEPEFPDIEIRTIHGYDRAYRMAGSGPALLMIHGIGDNSDTWRKVMPELSRRYTVIAPDLLGHGRSAQAPGRLLGGRVRQRHAGPAHGPRRRPGDGRRTLVGGGVAAQFAYEYPERCERLVLVSTGGVSRTVSPLLRLAAAPGVDLLMPVLSAPPMLFGGRLVGELLRFVDHGLGLDVEEIMRVFGALPNAEARQAIVRTLRCAIDWHGQVITMLDRAYLCQDVPTLILWGDKDAIIPVEHAHVAHEHLATSRLEIFEHSGHFPHHTDPERFVAAVVEFMESTAPVRFTRDEWRRLLLNGSAVSGVEPDDVAVA